MLSSLITAALPFTLIAMVAGGDIPEVSVPATCSGNFSAGSSTVLLTVPYPPSKVVEVIGDFQNLTWSGNPPDTVTLNGTNNEVGTARMYTTGGVTAIETLSEFYRPALTCIGTAYKPEYPRYHLDMSYYEAHTFAHATFNGDEVYMPFDGISVTSTCFGNASILNYTANFCATDVPTTKGLLDTLHTSDIQMVQQMLGNANFTNCEGLWFGGCF